MAWWLRCVAGDDRATGSSNRFGRFVGVATRDAWATATELKLLFLGLGIGTDQ